MRRRRIIPDNRYRWNDPDLPVWFSGRWWKAEDYQKLCQREIENNRYYLDYKNDPSYNWRKDKIR